MLAFERVARYIERVVNDELSKCGLFYRVFTRVKTDHSLKKKIEAKGYAHGLKLATDMVGIRVVCYFNDDVQLVDEILCRKFGLPCERVRDSPSASTFQPTRLNIVFRIPATHIDEVKPICDRLPVDSTFELQLRTVLSEGWHEIDHDMRYKCRDDWGGNEDLDRTLNGILATLETADWTTLQLFDELSLRHYRQRKWPAMVRARFRLRMKPSTLSARISGLLDGNRNLAKTVFRSDRTKLVRTLSRSALGMPMTVDNVVFLANLLECRDTALINEMPDPLREEFEELAHSLSATSHSPDAPVYA